jgi:hypothetical protein
MTCPCDDAPIYPRCPECGSMPLEFLHDLCREPLRQIAKDMCAEQMTEVRSDPFQHLQDKAA